MQFHTHLTSKNFKVNNSRCWQEYLVNCHWECKLAKPLYWSSPATYFTRKCAYPTTQRFHLRYVTASTETLAYGNWKTCIIQHYMHNHENLEINLHLMRMNKETVVQSFHHGKISKKKKKNHLQKKSQKYTVWFHLHKV